MIDKETAKPTGKKVVATFISPNDGKERQIIFDYDAMMEADWEFAVKQKPHQKGFFRPAQ